MNNENNESMNRARELFLAYHGNRFYMDHDGTGVEYEGYHVPKETEEKWADEYVSEFLNSKTNGKEAVRSYSAVSDLAVINRNRETWKTILYYPLRSEHLDDVSVLFMLLASHRMAERAVKKHRISKREVQEYVNELDGFMASIKDKSKNEALSRAEDYEGQEFSDPQHTADYLNRVKRDWNELLRLCDA